MLLNWTHGTRCYTSLQKYIYTLQQSRGQQIWLVHLCLPCISSRGARGLTIKCNHIFLFLFLTKSPSNTRMILISHSYWPGRSKGRWRKQSRSRQSHFHTPSPRFLRAYHRAGYSDTTTWSRAMPRLSHSWEKSQHKHVRGLNVNTAYQGEERVNGFFFWIMGEGVTWRGGSRLGKRSGSCCDDLLPFPRSALCFQTPAATGEQKAESESPNQNHSTTTVTIDYRSRDTRCQTHTLGFL